MGTFTFYLNKWNILKPEAAKLNDGIITLNNIVNSFKNISGEFTVHFTLKIDKYSVVVLI